MLFAKAGLLMLEYLSILIVITPLLKCRMLYVGVLILLAVVFIFLPNYSKCC